MTSWHHSGNFYPQILLKSQIFKPAHCCPVSIFRHAVYGLLRVCKTEQIRNKEKIADVYSDSDWGATPGPRCVRTFTPLRKDGFLIAAGMSRFHEGWSYLFHRSVLHKLIKLCYLAQFSLCLCCCRLIGCVVIQHGPSRTHGLIS